ncbi:hypothetical protein BJ878DRAFT_317109 [Calycina marina]|uniref:Uncharacterized protein n=1 Tax=Calycina marina TaxID=1763456 RepID=A0A9P7YUW5_9HELO|nr:hypothetical protein BJ878DRAFT_317109 [Calycina marina]
MVRFSYQIQVPLTRSLISLVILMPEPELWADQLPVEPDTKYQERVEKDLWKHQATKGNWLHEKRLEKAIHPFHLQIRERNRDWQLI